MTERTPFITEDFLLESQTARELYRRHAAPLPIIDYHSHVSPADIAADRRFENLGRLWLEGDHYKWRAMRAAGAPERFVTGDAPDREKFQRWAETVPRTLRNPLYHWTHLELVRTFGIEELLDGESAERIWGAANERLAEPGFTCRGLLERFGVEWLCTTDDPVDSLEAHRVLAADESFKVGVYPTWRPDRALAIDDPVGFNRWVDALAAAADVEIVELGMFMEALRRRHAYFHEHGCRLSDHGLAEVYADDYTASEVHATFGKVRARGTATPEEVRRFRSAMLFELALLDFEKGWVQQFHLGAIRNLNPRMFARVGADAGFDSIGDPELGLPLARMLARLDRVERLAPTILYNLNPRDNHLVATMAGNFQDGSRPGKIQWGSAWWYLDQKNGIEAQLDTLSDVGLLSVFVGMLTDSRSFLSYPRHEYFRRILCNRLGEEIERGLLPRDLELVGGLVEDVCHHNAARYFGVGAGDLSFSEGEVSADSSFSRGESG